MKKNITIIALIAVIAAILLYFITHEPKPVDSHKDDYERAVADNKAFNLHSDLMQNVIDSLETVGHAKDSVIAALKADKKVTQKQADKYAVEAVRLAKEVKELSKLDTSALARKADSLAEAAMNFEFLYNQYKTYGDSLTIKMEQQADDFLHALDEQRRLYNELKQMYDGLMKAYTDLFKDVGKLQKTIRRERLKTKIAALLALIAGGAAVVK